MRLELRPSCTSHITPRSCRAHFGVSALLKSCVFTSSLIAHRLASAYYCFWPFSLFIKNEAMSKDEKQTQRNYGIRVDLRRAMRKSGERKKNNLLERIRGAASNSLPVLASFLNIASSYATWAPHVRLLINSSLLFVSSIP